MSDDIPPEAAPWLAQLDEILGAIAQGAPDGIERQLRWDIAMELSRRLHALGGLALMRAAADRLRRRRTSMTEELERAWRSIGGYEPKSRLP